MDNNEPFVYNEVNYKTPKQSPQSSQTWPMDKIRQSIFQQKMSSLLSPVTPNRNCNISNARSLLLQCLRDAKSDPLPRRRFPVACSDEGILMDGVLVTSATAKKVSDSPSFSLGLAARSSIFRSQRKNTEFSSPRSESAHKLETTRSQKSSDGKGEMLASSPCTPKVANPSKLQASAEPFIPTSRQASPFPHQQLPYDRYNPQFLNSLLLQPHPYFHRLRPLLYVYQRPPLLPLLPHGPDDPYELNFLNNFPSLSGNQTPIRRNNRRNSLPTTPSSSQPNTTTTEPPVHTPISTTPTASVSTSTTTVTYDSSPVQTPIATTSVYERNRDNVKDQRKFSNIQASEATLGKWYDRGAKVYQAELFRKGACDNCGANTHDHKNCMERPRRIGAKFTKKNIAADEKLKTSKLDYVGKRDRWEKYDTSKYYLVQEDYEAREDARKKYKEERLDKVMEKLNKLGDRKTPACGTANPRVREDTAKYLFNLGLNSAYYDPKSRSMREDPRPDTNPNDKFYRGDNDKPTSASLKDFVPSIERFADTYKMDCSAAVYRLVTSGVPATVEHRAAAVASTSSSASVVAECVQNFITSMDSLKLNMVAVDQVYPLLSDLSASLNKLSILPPDFEGKMKMKEWLLRLSKMGASDELTEQQARQLHFDLESSYNSFMAALPSAGN